MDDEKDSDKLTAYKTDLEYLDDHFQVLNHFDYQVTLPFGDFLIHVLYVPSWIVSA